MPALPHVEVEIKLAGKSGDVARELARAKGFGGYRLQDCGADTLETIYLDTADWALASAGLVLRVRRERGGKTLSLKGMGQVFGAYHARPELEFPLRRMPSFPWRRVPRIVAPYLTVHAAGRPLRPVLVTTVRRHTFHVDRIVKGERSPVAEIACDDVEIRAPAGRADPLRYGEIEVEQKGEGGRTDLQRIAQCLCERFPLRPGRRSKFESGMRHFYGTVFEQAATRLTPRRYQREWERWYRADVALRLGNWDALKPLAEAVSALRQNGEAELPRQLARDLGWLAREFAQRTDDEPGADGPMLPGPSRRSVLSRRALGEALRVLRSARYLRLVRALQAWVRQTANA